MRIALDRNEEEKSRLWYFKKTNVNVDKVSESLDKLYNSGYEICYIYSTIIDGSMDGYIEFHYNLRKNIVIDILSKYDFTIDCIKPGDHLTMANYYKSQQASDNTKIEFGDINSPSHNKRKGTILSDGINHVFSMSYHGSMIKELHNLEKLYLDIVDLVEYICLLPVPDQDHVQVYVRFHKPKHIDHILDYFGEIYTHYTIENELSPSEIISNYFDFKETELKIFEYGNFN